ncbi:hypothetical protein FDB42_02095 [Clostridium botulinum]|nr:hypothetical protein [Clostridium botulinum]
MNKAEIIKALRDKKKRYFSVDIVTEKGTKTVFDTKDGWKMNCFLGDLYYTDEELANELIGWDEEIIYID